VKINRVKINRVKINRVKINRVSRCGRVANDGPTPKLRCRPFLVCPVPVWDD
jgi:hypothetical protein